MTENTINAEVTMGGATGALLAGRYRVVRQLGQGGMGSVWLAEDTKLDGFKVAIKMLPSVLVNNKRAYAQVKAEALVSLKLSHPNIATVRAFEEESGSPFLVMDYIDGQTLDDYLAEKGKLTEEETVKLLKPVAAALDYAHAQGVVHRDVKPGNVMIRRDGTPFVLDFGIAREIQETMTRVTGKLSSGTLMYMSPEQVRGLSPTASQDVYSLAAVAYECLVGHPPFYRGQIEYQIVNETPESLPHDTSLARMVMRALTKKPSERPPKCSDLVQCAYKANDLSNPYETYPKDDASTAVKEEDQRIAKDQRNEAVAFAILEAKIKVRRHEVDGAFDEVEKYCQVNNGFNNCLELAKEALSKLQTIPEPVSASDAKLLLEKLDQTYQFISKLINNEIIRRNVAEKLAKLQAEIEKELIPRAKSVNADTYAQTLWERGLEMLHKAQQMVESGDCQKAITEFQRAKDIFLDSISEAQKNCVQAIFAILNEYEKAGMWDEFERELSKGLKISPENKELKDFELKLKQKHLNEFVLCASINGREVRPTVKFEHEELKLPMWIKDGGRDLTKQSLVMEYEEDGIRYWGYFNPHKVDYKSARRFVVVPLHPVLNLWEMVGICVANNGGEFWAELVFAFLPAALAGVMIGLCTAAFVDGEGRLPVGRFIGVISFFSTFYVIAKNNIVDLANRIRVAEDRYVQLDHSIYYNQAGE